MIAIGLGGNVGDVRERFVRAREALGAYKSAKLYRTAPIGPPQPAFLNTAVLVRWDDAQPSEVIARVLETERLLGRDRRGEARWGPRTIDLDVLLWDRRAIATPELEVPHPRLAERRFVLRPLIDLLGEDFALAGSTLGALERRTTGQELAELAATW